VKQLHDHPSSQDRGHADTAVERLFELAVLLADGMERGLAERGLSRARAELMWRIGRHGPLTQRQLSRALACTPRNVTGLVDALEAAGLVMRRPHPDDRRATLVSLTARGGRAARAMQADYRKLGESLFSDRDEAEVDRFVGELDRIISRLRSQAVEPDQTG